MSLHAELNPETLQRLHAQRRNSTISSVVIAVLVVVLIALILGVFLLPKLVTETPVIVTYESSVNEETEIQEKKVQTSVERKPSAPSSSMARVITANTQSPTAIPVPDVQIASPSLDFGSGDDFGSGWETGEGKAGGFSFFGKKTATTSIVFVFDISGSMIMGAKTPETYEVLEKEIAEAISQLSGSTTFGVIAFSRDADSYRKELSPATGSEIANAIKWLKRMSPIPPRVDKDKPVKSTEVFKELHGGRHMGTRADLALEAAMKLEPETIIFVSDGEPTGAPASAIFGMISAKQKTLPKPVKIDAVAYMTKEGVGFMKNLAKQNNGEFREVNPGVAKK